MEKAEIQDLIPQMEVLLSPLDKDEGRKLLQILIGALGPGSPQLEIEDIKRAISRETNMIISRSEGPVGGRPNLVNKYVNRFNTAIDEGDEEEVMRIREKVKETLSRSSYYKFSKLVNREGYDIDQRGRPSKVDLYIKQYNEHKDNGRKPEARTVIENARKDLSPSSYYKLLRELHLKKKQGIGRPSKVEIYENAYMDHIKDGNYDFAESVLDYARSKISRSSYFKLKKRLSDGMDTK
ncbi:MAG: hypothetical protein U9R75_02345 [Candidatus Thermoplasmatota archaeon]|nr:hypothetical protein [Candidatus Thermoplasmatota archaeon]